MEATMSPREQFLAHLWQEAIDAGSEGDWIDDFEKDQEPGTFFGKAGEAISRMRSAGITKEDIVALVRWASYEAVFATLYALDDPGVDDTEGLYEDLLTAQPE